jgi:hypothetical protein
MIMSIDLDGTLQLAVAGRYAFADDATAVLPRSYGDFLSATVIPTDNEDGGFLPATLIDRLNWVYCLNDAPVPSSPAPQIFIGDQLQDPSVYVWVASGDYQGIGRPISYVQFLYNPGTRGVSWRGYGTKDGVTGLLMDNPLYAIYDTFSTYGGWTLDDIDWPTSFETFRTLTTLNAQMRWCFWAQRTYREWLTEILKCYHVDHFETSDGKLAMVLDRGLLGLSVSVSLPIIDAQKDLEGTEDDVEFESDEANYVNTLTVKRRIKWTTNEYTDEPTVDHQTSVWLYGVLRGEIELPALYTDAHGLVWVQAFFSRYSYLPAIVRFTVRGMGYASALPGTYLGMTVQWLGWTQARLLKVLNQEVDPFGERVSFEAFDCGRFVTDSVTLPTVPLNSIRRRIRVADDSVDLTPPGPASGLTATGSYREIVLRWTAPGDLDYAYTEIWASTANNRATATHQRSSIGAPGALQQESFAVADGSSYFVWLITVDRSGNGRDGGTGPTSGNWFPASPTGGLPAAPVLVQTGGIGIESVMFKNVTATRASFITYFNEQPMATSVLNGTFQQGFVIAVGQLGLTVPSLGTAVLQIRRGAVNGPVIGRNYVLNAITNPSTPSVGLDIDCWGIDFNPDWTGFYVITAQVISQAGAQMSYTPGKAELFLLQARR